MLALLATSIRCRGEGMPNEIPYKLQKTLLGKIRVKFNCPSCDEMLENDLTEAGSHDACPACKARFVVPGVAERMQREAQLRRDAEEKKREAKSELQIAEQRQFEAEELARSKRIELQEKEKQQRIAQEDARLEKLKLHSGFVYHVQSFFPEPDNCALQFKKFLNHFTEDGWVFVSLDIVQTYRGPGCIASLLGMTGNYEVHHLVTFKRHLSGSGAD